MIFLMFSGIWPTSVFVYVCVCVCVSGEVNSADQPLNSKQMVIGS